MNANNVLIYGIIVCAALLATQPVFGQMEEYTCRLTQSTGALELWTTPPSERVFKDDPVPSPSCSEVLVYAARHEFEPFQIVARPTSSGAVTVSIGEFGGGISTELYQVMYVQITQVSDHLGRLGDYPDPLWPRSSGETVSLTAGQNTAFWFSVSVPATTPAGDYQTTVGIGGISVPVHLHVFNFAIPDELHVKSQMNLSVSRILTAYSVPGYDDEYWRYVDMINTFFIDHRLTPKNPLWPGGLTSGGGGPFISYDCAGTLTDPYGIWGFEEPAARYLAGTGLMQGTFQEVFNGGTGFPSLMGITFANNDPSSDQRPASFCGQTRSSADWYTVNNPNSPYNLKWAEYMGEVEDYLERHNVLDRAYHYMANEPQDQADYDAVAWYSNFLKNAAPSIRIMVSEEPKPEIFDHYHYVSGNIDIWLAVLQNFNPVISSDRELNHGEETWIYFLYGTRPPWFNPITLDHPGIESKLTGWYLWKYRIRGLAYYSMNNWYKNPWTDPLESNHNGDLFMLYPPSMSNTPIAYGSNNHRLVPSIRLELMRDGLEDYEYLHLLNGGIQPVPGQANTADPQADKIIGGLTSYTRNGVFMANLRRVIGLYLGGEASEIPDIAPTPAHPRAAGEQADYFINFQNPAGEPTANPLIVNGKTYEKIGWNNYDSGLGYGWFGNLTYTMYQYLGSGPDILQRSVVYDDWGRLKTFDFDCPNGIYRVTVSVGWQWGTYNHHRIFIEGIPFIDNEATSSVNDYYLVRTETVTVQDHKLNVEMGIFDEYTMLNYLEIEVADSDDDGMTDTWEVQQPCLNPREHDAGDDTDHDNLLNITEFTLKTNPCDDDSDDGGENDGSEYNHGREVLDGEDDLDLTIALSRAGSVLTIDWPDGQGDNADIDGDYYLYRSGSPVLLASDLLAGPIDDGVKSTQDTPPSGCDPCYYRLRNCRIADSSP